MDEQGRVHQQREQDVDCTPGGRFRADDLQRASWRGGRVVTNGRCQTGSQ